MSAPESDEDEHHHREHERQDDGVAQESHHERADRVDDRVDDDLEDPPHGVEDVVEGLGQHYAVYISRHQARTLTTPQGYLTKLTLGLNYKFIYRGTERER